MNKKYFVFLFFVLLIIVAGVLYLFNTRSVKQGNLWQMLPNTPAMVLQTDHAGVFLDKLSQNNAVSEALIHTKGFHPVYQQLTFLKSILGKKKAWMGLFRKGELFVAVYPGTKKLLFLLGNKKLPRLEGIKNFLQTATGNDFTLRDVHLENIPVPVIKIMDKTSHQPYWLWRMGNALIITTQESLMKASISGYSMQEMHFSDNPDFEAIKKTSGKLVDARLYLYYPSLGKLFSRFVNNHFKRAAQSVSQFAKWGETDLMVQPQEIIFSGYTTANSNNILGHFNNQQPVPLSGYTLFPFNTTFSFTHGFSDFPAFKNKNTTSQFKAAYRSYLKQLIKYTGNNVSIVSNSLTSVEIPLKTWAVIQLNNPPKAALLLKKLAIMSGDKKLYHSGNYTIRQINISHLLPTLYGENFSAITRNFYCIINGFAVFANSPDALSNFIRYSETGKTLDLDENYKSFSNNLAGTSNLLLQFRPRAMTGLIGYFLNKETAGALSGYTSFLKNIEGVAFQYSRDASLYYTNFYFRYNKAFREENLALWKTKLDGTIVGKPFLVKDHKSNKYDIIVFDNRNKMYLIGPTGKILWTKRLPQLPLSHIFPVDYYKNRKIQFLFNTKDQLFIIDRKGHFVAGYPIALHPNATNGLSLFDYTHHKDYRILLAQADKRIYDYKINGNEVNGWKKPQMQAMVTQKVVRLLVNRKDYIIISDKAHHVKIVNRRGQQRIYLKAPVNKALHSTYFVNRTNNKGIILTTNTDGKLVYINTSGRLRFTDFGKFSPGHYFLYDDFNGNGSKDFIFVDKNKLKVFDRFKKLLFSYTFNENITVQPEFFSLGDRQKVLGIVATKEKTIYLFDGKGNILINKGLTGETPFTVGSLNNNREVNIITATGSTLYNYRIK